MKALRQRYLKPFIFIDIRGVQESEWSPAGVLTIFENRSGAGVDFLRKSRSRSGAGVSFL